MQKEKNVERGGRENGSGFGFEERENSMEGNGVFSRDFGACVFV